VRTVALTDEQRGSNSAMNLAAFPPKCQTRRKRLPFHLTGFGDTVRAAGYRQTLGRRDARSESDMNTRPTALIYLAQGANLVGAGTAVAAMVEMGGGARSLASLFTPWVLLPFVATSIVLTRKPSSAVAVCAFLLGSVLAVLEYYGFLAPHGRIGSTAALGFIFIPFWHTIWVTCAGAYAAVVEFRKAHALCPNCGDRYETTAKRCPSCGADRSERDPKPVLLGPPLVDSTGGYRCTACNARVNYGRSQCDACGQQFLYHS
jgi:hypothetical protein